MVISGDTRFNENLIRHAAAPTSWFTKSRPFNPSCFEQSPTAAVARRILGFHTSPEDAGRVFARVKPRLAVFTHVALLTTDRNFHRRRTLMSSVVHRLSTAARSSSVKT